MNKEDQISLSPPEALAVINLNKSNLFVLCGLLTLYLIYVFFEGILPVILSGNIAAIQFKSYNQLPFFVISLGSFIFVPLGLFYSLWRNGTVYFYESNIVFHRSIGGTRSIKYDEMLVRQNPNYLFICNYSKLCGANWIRTIWIEAIYGIITSLTANPDNVDDAPKALSILKEKVQHFEI